MYHRSKFISIQVFKGHGQSTLGIIVRLPRGYEIFPYSSLGIIGGWVAVTVQCQSGAVGRSACHLAPRIASQPCVALIRLDDQSLPESQLTALDARDGAGGGVFFL